MTALADLKTRIADEIDRTDAASQIANAITTAIRAYKFNRFAFNEGSEILTTLSGLSEYSEAGGLPTGILQIDTARITINASSRYLLEHVAYSEIDRMDTSSTYTSRPIWYAWHEQKLRLYPTPNDAYVITLRYLADIDEEDWCTYAEALVRCRAKRDLYTHWLFDSQMAAMMAQAEADELRALKREAMLKQSSGRIVPHD